MVHWLWLAWLLRGPDGVPTAREVALDQLFTAESVTLPAAVDPALSRVAEDTARWLRAHPDDPGARGSLLEELPRDGDAVLHTLDTLAASGSLAGARTVRWRPDPVGAREAGISLDDRIRLTRYLVYRSVGSLEQTEQFDTALYAVPDDSTLVGLSRPEVFAGAYAPGGPHAGAARPLVYLSRRDVNRALMQGTVEVHLPDGSARTFNVHVNNARPYQRGLSDANQQPRYWYFREVDGVRGYGREDKIRLEPGVSVAGDVYGLGVGTVLWLEEGGWGRLVVLADTGGAFQPNLFQLDLFTGAFSDHAAFEAATSEVPRRVRAWVVVLDSE